MIKPSETPASRRVVVTGIGWVTPLGHDIESVWSKLLAGTSAIAPITHFDASTFPTTFAAEVRDYDFADFVQHPEYHEGVGRNTAYALGAAVQAWQSSGLDQRDELDRSRVGIYLGSGEGVLDFDNYVASNLAGWDADQRAIDAVKWVQTAAQKMQLTTELEQEPNMPLYHLACELQAGGPCYNCLTACAASTQAIGEAVEILRRGHADVMIGGGAHTMIHPFGVTGFNRLTALSNRNDDPPTASRPFDRNRDGFVLGEGAGMVVLESLDHARARGANILAEITGYGSSADAFRITDMHPDGQGPVAAMRGALDDAKLDISDIDYISAHGTGTQENDKIESKAIGAVFGDRASQVPVSSIKSMFGHLIAAAGAVELIVCVLAIRDGRVPPTVNYQTPDPNCPLDYVPNDFREVTVDAALSNSFGFGGQNDTLAVQRYSD